MKNSNLLNRLLSYSHEKQSPQRFGRYAAMLIMLLTLGVGQMWGATIFNCGIDVNGTWYKGTGTINSGHWLESKTAYSNHNFGAITSLELGGQYETWDNNQTDYCSWNGNNGIWITIKKSSTQIDNFKLSCYHKKKDGNNNVWETKGGTGGCSDSGSWGTYTVDISGYAAGNDYTIKASWTSPSAQYNEATAKFTINPVVTFKANGGTGSDYTQRVTYNTSTALTANTFTRTGYDFAGWATSADGNVVYAGGANVKLTAHTTLYAKWLPQSLTITSHPTYLTTTDKLNLSIEYANIPSGYCYRVKVGAGYYNNSSNQDRDAISGTGSATFTSYSGLPLGANTVVVELWKNSPFEKQSVVSDGVTVTVEQAYLVNVQAKTDGVESTIGGTVSPASVNASAHLGQTITASEPNTGYDFNGWTANTPNITFADPSALSTTVYATAGGWVYANYVRQSGSYSTTFYAGDHGSINAKGTAIAKNGSASVTIGENETLSATPESADYVFDHWGTTGSVSVANIYSATTTVTATAAGGTVTAYYRHIPVLGAVTATPSGTQNYAGSPIDFALSVTSTYMAHPVVVFLVNDGTTTYEVVGAPYGADGSSAAGTIGSDAAYTTVHKATFTASAAKSYTVSAKLYEGELIDNFEGANTRGWAGDNLGSGSMTFANNPVKMTVNGSNKVMQVTRTGGADWGGAIMSFTAVGDRATCDAAGSNDYAYIHARMKDATDATHLKNNDEGGNSDDINPSFVGATSSDWRHVTYHNTHCSNNFLYFMIQRGNTDNKTVYIDDIILSNEASMTVKASQAATASFSINWNYTVTLNNNGATSAGTESVNVTYGSATGISDITVPTKTGYTFGGYYTEDAGAGTLQINASGVWQNGGYVSGGNWNSGSNQTLYAKWTAKTYDITYVDANNVATIATNPSTGSTDATINFTVTLNPGFKSLSVTAVDAGSNTVTVTNPSSNNYRFTMPASAVTVTVSATALPIVYVLKTKHASSSLGDGATGLPATGQIWAWKASGSNNFYTTPGSFPGPSASSKATAITDDIIGDEWYRFIPDNISQFDGSTAYHVILTNTNRILDTQSTFIENGSSRSAATHTGTIWIVPHGTDANTAYLYTSYPDEIVTPYNTTYYAGDHGNINVFGTTITSGNSQTIATTKNRTLTATPASGYEFNRWITTGSVTVADATSATTTVSATGAGGTVTATYFETVNSGWYIKGHPAGDDWDTPTSLPLNRVLPGETNVYYRPVTLPANDQYFRFWCSTGGNHEYGASTNNLAVTKGTKYNLTYNGGNSFKYSAGGTVWFVVDASGATKKFWLQDPVEFYSVNFGYSDGCKTFSAKDGEGNDLVSGNTYVSGTELTFTQTKKDGYTFVGWNTAADGSGSSLGTGSSYTVASLSADVNVYAIYTENKTAITITTDGHGTITTPSPNNSPYSLGVATSQAINATASEGYHWNTWTTSGNAALGMTATTASNTAKGNGAEGGTGTVTATFTPNTYTVRFHRNGGAGDVVEQNFTYGVAQNLTANTYTKTGYNFAGWALAADAAVTYADEASVSNLTSTNSGTFHLYAKWTPKTTTITYSQSGTGYGSGGQSTTQTATYDAAMPTPITTPTAANGYAFMGYYDALEPLGNKYYNADGTSARTWNKEDAEATLYAYFKKAEITALEASPGVIAPGETITITPTIEPTPTGTTKVCYELQYSNGTPLPSQPTFTPGAGNAVSFPVPSASATYIIQAVLETGSTCGSGTELSRRTTTFQVAGAHDVTVKYMCGDLTIKASEVLGEIRPLTWSDDITAPTITGYTFARWDAGDGVTIKDNGGEDKTTSTSSTIKIKAVYDGTLTAVYNKKNMIFFNNTLGWEDVYVYFYNSEKYWDNTYGTGAKKEQAFDGSSQPYYEEEHGHMTQIEGTNIWYFDYSEAGYTTRLNVAFTKDNKHNTTWFWKTEVVRRGDHKSSLPMFVPLTTKSYTKNECDYYNEGYWMNYPENTGYTLKIYNAKTAGVSDELQSIPFEFSEDKTMPMTVKVELNANREYGYEIHRADGNVYGKNSKVLKINDSGDVTPETLTQKQRGGIQTSVAGDYEFTLDFGDNGGYHYLIGVHYPVAANDYRIVYTDEATWSKAAHTSGWYHPSRAIHKEEGSKDIVSFYVSKAGGANAGMKFQYASAIEPSTGVVTWMDVPSGTIDLSGITESGVYNFHLSQDASSISVEKIEPYTGNYYIRTDCAGNSKWENFRTSDHQMTYSDYAEVNSGYSHYYTRWVTNGTNVKFCIANDYSQCISDTLAEDYGTVIANINAGGTLESGNASIRFMWDYKTNKVSRAYISGSTNISDRFLVLEGDAKMYDENGNSLNITGLNANEINLVDDQNFVYERTIQVNTGAKAKLTAKYNNNVQYFKGGAGTAAADSVELLGGNAAGKHSMRIVYDFKTNRLVTAYIPSGTIEDNIAINADLMIVREHQEAGQQLLFNGGSLSKVHTVYGVMRFNRWTLNNKETTGSHDPVGDPKSAYERALYWISFPFNVNLSDVFGFGTYGTHWIIMEYDGAERAQKGYWKDSKGFWKYVTNRNAKVLEAGKGYVLALDLDLMKYDDTSFWSHNIEQVELFFPSASEVNNISETNVQTTVAEHECTIDRRTDKSTPDINKDRTKADSHWNMIGIPSYANYGTTLTDGEGGSTITWNSNPYTNDLPFLYEWNMVDNTYTVQSGTTYPFKSMHAYMVQYHGNLYWSLASATPVSPIVARRTYAEKPQNVELRLELSQNEMKVDQTFVKLSNDENASTKFAFDEDLCKEYNANKANIYTFIEGYIPAGGNTLPMTEQTMVVPVGVQIAANGDYTFAIPEGTEGIGITLIDNETGIRTSLSALDYTINLPAGTYNDRFLLEISPVHQSPTGIELLNGENGENGVRKVLIDNILYIVKDGVMYDARGSRVQ